VVRPQITEAAGREVEIQLSRLTLFAPDEMTSRWFISRDFAGDFGLEYSSEAAKLLRKALPRGAEVEYEADAVTVTIARKSNVVPALLAIYECLGWDPAEVLAAEPRVLSYKRPQPRKLAVGDVFLVPVAEGLFGIGQVLDVHYGHPTVAVFRVTGAEGELELGQAQICRSKPLTILHTLGNSLLMGKWRIIGNRGVRLNASSGPGGEIHQVGSVSYGWDGPVVEILRAHIGIGPWNPYPREQDSLVHLVME
jgi:hypothetical protein